MTFSDWQTWVFLGAVGFLALDHFRLRSEVGDLRVHLSDNFVNNKHAEKIEEALGKVVKRLDDVVVQLARMEGQMQGSPKQ